MVGDVRSSRKVDDGSGAAGKLGKTTGGGRGERCVLVAGWQ